MNGCGMPANGRFWRRTPEAPVRLRNEQLVWCARLEVDRTVNEHAHCPYCFGDLSHIATADHSRFCDYKPGTDPIHFGFPAELPRHRGV